MGREAEDDLFDLLPVGLRDEEAIGNDSEASCKVESEAWCKILRMICKKEVCPFYR